MDLAGGKGGLEFSIDLAFITSRAVAGMMTSIRFLKISVGTASASCAPIHEPVSAVNMDGTTHRR